MFRPARIAFVVIGLAAAVYGAASLTGGWLGTPPWWERAERAPEPPVEDDVLPDPIRESPGTLGRLPPGQGDWCGTGRSIEEGDEPWRAPPLPPTIRVGPPTSSTEPPPSVPEDVPVDTRKAVPVAGREWISGGVVAVGLGLAAWGAWPRRRREVAS